MNTHHWLRAFLTLVVTCAAVVLFSASAFACGDMHGKGQMPVYSDLDANGDGAVTAEEFYAFRSQRMAARAEEGRKMKNAANAPSFEDLDLDGDENLSEAEFKKHHEMCPMKSRKGKGEHAH